MSSEKQKARILVVDDEPGNAQLISALLADEYDVLAADSGERALEMIHGEAPPDLVLLDLMMPKMDGYEVLQRIKQNGASRNIPVIFLTASTRIRDEARCFRVGAVDYIQKPIIPAVLDARVRTHLALYDQSRTLEGMVRERTAELRDSRYDFIRCLSRAVEYRDDATGFHVVRMSHYSRMLALEIGLDEDHAERLYNIAPMHDVGKIGVPDAILQKPGPLTDEEWAMMRRHSSIGADIIGEQKSPLLNAALSVALCHHEKWDGSGYPRKLSGDAIPVDSRIVAIADVFDALTSVRPYKPAWSTGDAALYVESESGRHFDPVLVQAFTAIAPEIIEIRGRFGEAPPAAST